MNSLSVDYFRLHICGFNISTSTAHSADFPLPTVREQPTHEDGNPLSQREMYNCYIYFFFFFFFYYFFCLTRSKILSFFDRLPMQTTWRKHGLSISMTAYCSLRLVFNDFEYSICSLLCFTCVHGLLRAQDLISAIIEVINTHDYDKLHASRHPILSLT